MGGWVSWWGRKGVQEEFGVGLVVTVGEDEER